jgi:hypothetical protein
VIYGEGVNVLYCASQRHSCLHSSARPACCLPRAALLLCRRAGRGASGSVARLGHVPKEISLFDLMFFESKPTFVYVCAFMSI